MEITTNLFPRQLSWHGAFCSENRAARVARCPFILRGGRQMAKRGRTKTKGDPMSIDIDTARKVAKLARIRVEEDRLPDLARELSGILGFMEQLNEVNVDGVEPMVSVTPMRLKRRADVVTDGNIQAQILKNAPDAREGSSCGAEGGGMSAPMTSANTWTIAAAREALRKGEISAVDLTMSCLTAMDAADGLNAFVHKTPDIALDQARAADARIAKGDARRCAGFLWGSRICS